MAQAIDHQALAAAVGATVAQAMAAHQAAHQPPPPAAPVLPAVGPFALAPALARQNVLDYTNDPGAIKIYSKAVEPLPTTLTKTDPNVKVFLNELNKKSVSYGWTNLFDINIAAAGAVAQPISLLKQHGCISLAQCRASADGYIDADNRDSQNNYQLYMCVSDSVDEELKQMMSHYTPEYTVGAANNKPCGVCFTKALLAKVEIDTRATAARIRQSFTQLKANLKERFDENVVDFNEYLRGQIDTLDKRGDASTSGSIS